MVTGADDCVVTQQNIIDRVLGVVGPGALITDNCSDSEDLTFTFDGGMATYGETCSMGSTPHVISYDVTDECGNVSSGSFNLTINDTTAPVINNNTSADRIRVYVPATSCTLDSTMIMDQIFAAVDDDGMGIVTITDNLSLIHI